MNNKILHITTAHKKNDIRIFQKEISSLHKSGFNISLIVQNDKDESIDGINIYSVPHSRNRFDRFIFTNIRIIYRVIKINPSICHFHDPDFIFGAVFLSILGKKIIYDVHEDVPKQIMSKYWIPSILRRFISISFNIVEKFCVKFFFTSIIAATDSISKNFPDYKTVVINNYPIISDLTQINQDYKNKENSIIYIGGISIIRGIYEILDAFEKIKEQDVKLYLAGSFENENLENEILNRIKNNKNIAYLGFLERKELLKYIKKSQLGLVLFHPEQNHIEASPNKMFEYMSLGVPVLASDFPLWLEIISKNQCGVNANPLDPNEIVSQITQLISDPQKAFELGQNGIRVVNEKFNWNIEEKKIIKLYKNIINV